MRMKAGTYQTDSLPRIVIPSRRYTGRFEIITILFGLLLPSHMWQERLKDDEVPNKSAFSC